MNWFVKIIVVIFLCFLPNLAMGQQQGEIGSYQGCVFVNGSWTVSALFSDYLDAQEWFKKQSGTCKVVDKNGLLIFTNFARESIAPKIPEVAPTPTQPKNLVGKAFKWITVPGQSTRTRIPGGRP